MTTSYRIVDTFPRSTPAIEMSRSKVAKVFDGITRGVMWGVLAVCLLVWAVVGFIFWVPLLVRAAARFSLELLRATFAGRGAQEAGEQLRDAVEFYRRGFAVAIEATGNRRFRVTQDSEERMRHPPRHLAWELAWAIIIWYPILLAFGLLEGSPVDLWNFIAALPLGTWIREGAASTFHFLDGLLLEFFKLLDSLIAGGPQA